MSGSEWDTDVAEQLIAGDFPTGGFIVIGSDVPAELQVYYQANYGGAVARAWIGLYTGPNTYKYEVVLPNSIFGQSMEAVGWVISGVVHEISITYWDGFNINQAWGQVSNVHLEFINTKLLMGSSTPASYSDQLFNGRSLGRGAQFNASATANSAAVGALTSVLSTSPSVFAIQPNRAYKFEVQASLQSNTVGADISGQCRANGTGVGSTLLIDFGRLYNNPVANLPYNMQPYGYFVNSTAGQIGITLDFCISASAGTVLMAGSATRPRWMLVTDVGAATDYPWALSV